MSNRCYRARALLALFALAIGIPSCAGGSHRAAGQNPSYSVAIDPDDVTESGTVTGADGAITLAGPELWDDPGFRGLDPPAYTTAAIAARVVVPVKSGSYIVNLHESGYSVQNSTLSGRSISGGAASRIRCRGVLPGDLVSLNGAALTAVASAPGPDQFQAGPGDSQTAISLAAALNRSGSSAVAGHFQAETGEGGDVIVEALAHGSAGNDYTLSSNSAPRLSVVTLDRGADHISPASETWSVMRWVRLPASIPAGTKLRFRFIMNAAVTPLPGAYAFLTIHFGDESINHTQPFLPGARVVTSREYSPKAPCRRVLVGLSIEGYQGRWDVSRWDLLSDSSGVYRRQGELSMDLDLSLGAGPPVPPQADGLGSRIKRVGFLIGNENKPEELSRFSDGDTIITEMGDPYHYPGARPLEVIANAAGEGLQVYGYVALGRDTAPGHRLPYPRDALERIFLRARALHLAGVYLDISSNSPPHELNGFGVSRWRQIWAVNRLHSLGLGALFNDSGSTVLSDTVDRRPADPDRADTADPGVRHSVCDGSPIPWESSDGIVAESWGLSDASGGSAQDWNEFVNQGGRLAAGKAVHGIRIYPLFYRLAGTAAQRKLQETYAYYATAAFGFDGYCLFDNASLTNDTSRPSWPIGSGYTDSAPMLAPGGSHIIRRTDIAVLELADHAEMAIRDPRRRSGDVHQVVSQAFIGPIPVRESANGGAAEWYFQTSPDGTVYTAAAPLHDGAGEVTGLPRILPRYLHLRCVLTSPDPHRSPAVWLPAHLQIRYPGGGQAPVEHP